MKCIVKSKFLGREGNTSTARKRRGLVVASNADASQFKISVEGLSYQVWIQAKDVKFI